VKHHLRSWRPAMRVLALALVLAALPVTGFAADGPQPVAKATPLATSIDKVVAAEKLDAAQAKPAARPDTKALGSPSFFKSKVGIVVLGVFAAGVGYATYSLSHDRIHSTTR
jgi:hypothetical protein